MGSDALKGILIRQIEGGQSPFVVGTLYTPSYGARAERLSRSCADLGLPLILCEVPTVHRSISQRGDPGSPFTKSAIIQKMLEFAGRPLLYADCDCVFRSPLQLIDQIASSKADFAIYNWLADACTDAFSSIHVAGQHGRFFRFSHSVDAYDPQQLVCSGAVQFWRDTTSARALLRNWQRAIVAFPAAADDHCLDFAFNNRDAAITTAWLPKSYCRYPWWICDEPIIDHPDRPSSGNAFLPIKPQDGRRRFYPEYAAIRCEPIFPRDAIIDTQDGALLKVENGKVLQIARTGRRFFIDPE